MPAIKEYTAQADALHPTETGADAYAQAGRRIGGFYNQAGEALKSSAEDRARAAGRLSTAEEERFKSYTDITKGVGSAVEAAEKWESHQQVNVGGVTEAQAFSQLTDAWNKTIKDTIDKDPNNNTIQAQFMEQQFEPWASKFIDSFTAPGAKDWAEARVEQLRTHFNTKTNADMSTLAGIATKANADKYEISSTNTARSDPSAVPQLLKSAEDYIKTQIDTHPHLTGIAAAQVESETVLKAQRAIVKGGALGSIERSSDPEAAAQAWAAKYPNLVDAQEMDQLAKAARFYQRMNASEARSERLQRDYLAKDDFNKQVNQLEAATMPQNIGERPQLPKDYWSQLRDLATHPGAALEPGRLRTMVTQGEAITERLNKDDPVTDPVVRDELTQRLFDPKYPTTISDVIKSQDKLSDHDVKRLTESVKMLQQEELGDPVFKQTMAGAKEMIEQKVGGINLAAGKYAAFVQTFLPEYLAQKRAGTLPPNALDMNDPKSLISQSMQQYLGPLSKSLGNQVKANGGVGAPSSPPVYIAPKPGSAPQVKTKEEYDKLAPGTTFIGSDGKPYTKPKSNVTTLQPGQM